MKNKRSALMITRISKVLVFVIVCASCANITNQRVSISKQYPNWPASEITLPRASGDLQIIEREPGRIYIVDFNNPRGWSSVLEEMDHQLRRLGFKEVETRDPGLVYTVIIYRRESDGRVVSLDNWTVDSPYEREFTLILHANPRK
jgi:hypothetical protein